MHVRRIYRKPPGYKALLPDPTHVLCESDGIRIFSKIYANQLGRAELPPGSSSAQQVKAWPTPDIHPISTRLA